MPNKNFRDISAFNAKIKKGIIYRSSALCVHKYSHLNTVLKKYNIGTIIDLRANRELNNCNYSNKIKSKIEIIHAPFDPWAQSIEFKNTYNTGTNIEIAYQFFSKECKPSIKKVIEAIINSQNPIDIHCHAGKDRTGIVVTLLHLISEANINDIYLDYLASEADADKSSLQILLKIVKESGGIELYLKSCQLNKIQIKALKQKICIAKQ